VASLLQLMQAIWRLVVPSFDATPAQQWWWQVRVGCVVCFLFGAVTLLPFVAVGAVPLFSGFATSMQLQQLAIERRRDRAEEIDHDLLDLRSNHCAVLHDREKQNLYWSRIKPLMDRYYELTGRVYPLPNCSELQ
jgi:hypothetical protein